MGARSILASGLGWVVATASCAEMLGGLEEGTLRDPGVSISTDGGSKDASAPVCVAPWLPGYAHRTVFDVARDGGASGVDLPLRLGFDTRSAIAAGKMRFDGADIRVTGSDALTPMPYWIETGLGGEGTSLWTKLAAASTSVFLYYGNPTAEPQSSRSAVFIEGIVENAQFDRGTAPWIATQATNGGTSTLDIGHAEASISFDRDPASAPSSIGWCQAVTFPDGGRYRIVVDVTLPEIAKARPQIWIGGLSGALIWGSRLAVGPFRGVTTSAIDPGSTLLCLGATLDATDWRQWITIRFSNLRVVPEAFGEANAGLPRAEESACSER